VLYNPIFIINLRLKKNNRKTFVYIEKDFIFAPALNK